MPVKSIGGRYELIDRISSGGMGVVWRGYDTVLDREVAVKVIRPDMLVTPEDAADMAERFRREARITARIQHHGVPQVFDAVLDVGAADELYLVMEYVHGIGLRSYVDPADPLPISWAAAVGAQIATVLSYAHVIPVVHRDLKPDNVLVTPGGTVKVLDFGIAAILRPDVAKITATGRPVGTVRYMAPEQANGGRVTPRSDLYALGCLLHELLAGSPLFEGTSDYQLQHQHINQQPRPLRALRADVPEPLESLILDLLEKSPEQRPTDAYAVYERLLPYLPGPGSPQPTGNRRSLSVPDPTLMYRRPNAPRGRERQRRELVPPATTVDVMTVAPPALRRAIDDALARSDELLEAERYTQAADAVEAVIAAAGPALGTESTELRELRFRRALILFLGSDARTALQEFDALADVFARTEGPAGGKVLECRRYAALCRANLGQNTDALRQFSRLLDDVVAADGDAGELALDVRHSIGMLYLSEGDTAAAEVVFEALHHDHLVINGPDDERTREAAELLARIRRNNFDGS
ncbi:serine/threonine-protein kinase [Actinomadura rayongensis]|uniref:non-specific serine/threonine protein kinase n=1 Tax=Actinomadura rayongensis TaxID=1429076 RepID=A0A6I4W3V5_9ACTN|nr:serine/threonine-protein kinase [Actinomadura rayongensis]MXQ64847.1 protein kinase [Actinomadura rayongensis]